MEVSCTCSELSFSGIQADDLAINSLVLLLLEFIIPSVQESLGHTLAPDSHLFHDLFGTVFLKYWPHFPCAQLPTFNGHLRWTNGERVKVVMKENSMPVQSFGALLTRGFGEKQRKVFRGRKGWSVTKREREKNNGMNYLSPPVIFQWIFWYALTHFTILCELSTVITTL